MKNSFFAPGEVMLRRVVVGHVTQGERHIPARPLLMNRGENPCGGLYSSVRDQLRYARFTVERHIVDLFDTTRQLRAPPTDGTSVGTGTIPHLVQVVVRSPAGGSSVE